MKPLKSMKFAGIMEFLGFKKYSEHLEYLKRLSWKIAFLELWRPSYEGAI